MDDLQRTPWGVEPAARGAHPLPSGSSSSFHSSGYRRLSSTFGTKRGRSPPEAATSVSEDCGHFGVGSWDGERWRIEWEGTARPSPVLGHERLWGASARGGDAAPVSVGTRAAAPRTLQCNPRGRRVLPSYPVPGRAIPPTAHNSEGSRAASHADATRRGVRRDSIQTSATSMGPNPYLSPLALARPHARGAALPARSWP